MREYINNNNTSKNGSGLEITQTVKSRDIPITQNATQNKNKMLFIWLGVCIGFAFFAFAIVGLVIYLIKVKR